MMSMKIKYSVRESLEPSFPCFEMVQLAHVAVISEGTHFTLPLSLCL